MKSRLLKLSLLASSVALSFGASAMNYTQQNVAKAQEIINKTLDAYGGAEKISHLNQIIVDYDVTNTNAGQSLKPNPPWDTTKGDRVDAFDFQNQVTVTKFSGAGGGNIFAGRNIINGDNSANLNDVLKTNAKVGSPNFDVSAGPGIRTNGTFLLKRLQQYAGSARHLGEIDFEGKKHDLLSFTMPGGPAITLYIDQKNHHINKSERVSGPFLVEYYFKDYKTVDGILFPYENSYTVNGAPSQTFSAESYQVNKPLEKLTSIPSGYQTIETAPPQSIKTNDMGDGVYWVTQNNQNSMFVEFKDHVVMIGGLPGVTQRLEEFKKTVKDKPIKYTMMTHHHSDHIGGSQEVFDAGIEFLTVKEHEQVIRDTLAEENRDKAKFEYVNKKRVFDDGKQRLEIYDIGPTPHTEHFLLGYLPKQGIIFEADHFIIPATGPMPPRSPNIDRLVKAIDKLGIKVTKIASAHGTRSATFEQLMESYKKRM